MITKIIIITLLTITTISVNHVSTNLQPQPESSSNIYLNNHQHHQQHLPVADTLKSVPYQQQQQHQPQPVPNHPHISRTHIEWRRESSLDGDLNKEYYVEDHETIPIIHTPQVDSTHQHAQQYQHQQQYHPDYVQQQQQQQQIYQQNTHDNLDEAHRMQLTQQQQQHNAPQHPQRQQLYHQEHEQQQLQTQHHFQHQPPHQSPSHQQQDYLDHIDPYQQHQQQQHHQHLPPQHQYQPHANKQAQPLYQPYYQPEQPALPRQRLVVYSRLVNDDHIYESYDSFQINRPLDSCGSTDHDQHSVLMPHYMQPDEPFCRASTSPQQQQQHYNYHHQQQHSPGGNSLTTNGKTTTTTADSSERLTPFSQMNGRHNSNIDSYPLGPPLYPYESSLKAAIRHYWREVSGLCLASAIFLNWLYNAVKRRFTSSTTTTTTATIAATSVDGVRAEQALKSINNINSVQQQQQRDATATSITKGSVSRDTNSYSAHDSAFEENVPPLSVEDEDISLERSSSNELPEQNKSVLDKIAQQVSMNETVAVMRQRSSTLKAEPLPIPNSTNTSLTPNHHRSLSASLSNSLNINEYNSRYSSDFDSIQRLGRGGFGVVFEAKNKIDDCHYAVKRICLPLEKEARERVMREVRALAKLDHAGIVRYYNAWLETPPDDWLEQHDAQLGILHSKDGLSFPSTDGIYERNESDPATGSKLCDGGDNSSGCLFNNQCPFKRRRTNGYRQLLKDNSNSPLLDIVFEGSGSIRVESENISDDLKKDSESNNKEDNKSAKDDEDGLRESLLQQGNNNESDSNTSDSEDSDFIQFESRTGDNNTTGGKLISDKSVSSHLTDPFSSSDDDSDSNCGDDEQQEDSFSRKMEDDDAFVFAAKRVDEARKRALAYQKEVKQSLTENLHVEKVYLYIQMQLCRKDTLKDWLKTNSEARDKTTIFDLFYQIVDAVEYVHSQDLIHRDLKPSNIFFSLDGTLKIGDFGLCRAKTNVGVGSSLDLQEYFGESDVERGIEAVHTEQVGTQLYMSPEQLNGLGYNQKVDIFAMGLILLELLIPFKTQMQRVNVLFKARNNVYTNEFKEEYPKEHELVKSLLSRNPQKRPTASEIKQHELLASAQLSQPVIERIYHRRRTISSNSSTE